MSPKSGIASQFMSSTARHSNAAYSATSTLPSPLTDGGSWTPRCGRPRPARTAARGQVVYGPEALVVHVDDAEREPLGGFRLDNRFVGILDRLVHMRHEADVKRVVVAQHTGSAAHQHKHGRQEGRPNGSPRAHWLPRPPGGAHKIEPAFVSIALGRLPTKESASGARLGGA